MGIYRDGIHNNGVAIGITPAVKTAGESGPAVNLVEYGSAELVVITGPIAGAGNMSVFLDDAPDNNGSPGAWTQVPAGNLQKGSEVVDPLTASLAERIGYIGSQPWVRARSVLNSGTSIALAATWILGYPAQKPIL